MTAGSFWIIRGGPSAILRAAVEHDDLLGDLHHEAHVVLHDHHGDAGVAHAEQRLHELARLGGVEARGRLVQQQQPRARRQGARDLDEAADAGGQVRRRRLHPLLDADEAQQPAGLLARVAVLADGARQPQHRRREPAALARLAADHDVLAGGHLVEELRVLERPREAGPDHVARLAPDQLLAVEQHGALVGPVEPRERVEQRGLAGAVGADERLDGAFVHVERDVVHGREPAEPARHVAHLQQGHVASPALARPQAHDASLPALRRFQSPASPRGAKITMRTMARP